MANGAPFECAQVWVVNLNLCASRGRRQRIKFRRLFKRQTSEI
nr:hypothetical protein [uncultured Campylobacter sp.]